MKIVNVGGRPIAGCVEFVFLDSDQKFDALAVTIAGDGTLSVPTRSGLTLCFAVVKPVDGHWNWVIDKPSQHQTCVCSPIALPHGTTWWKAIVGRDALDPSAGEDIGIAVIDLGFQPRGSLSHVRVVDVEGEQPDLNYRPPNSHGGRVCKILGERGSFIDREGLAPGADLYLIDISDEETVDEFDGEKLAAAIEVAAEVYGVDLINISAGAYARDNYREYSDIIRKSVEFARNRGALVIAATGNDGQAEPAIPARFEEVVGVGAIGECDVAPTGSFMRHYQNRAAKLGHDRGVLNSNTGVFHYIETCFGPGLDVVGPGIGINIRYDETTIVEYVGTSYACPIVVGALACALSDDAAYRSTHGLARSQHAEGILRKICQDVGMDPLRQGMGLPIWRRR